LQLGTRHLLLIQLTKHEVCIDISLIRRLLPPPRCFVQVLLNTLAIVLC
jgi:hypothetical protein